MKKFFKKFQDFDFKYGESIVFIIFALGFVFLGIKGFIDKAQYIKGIIPITGVLAFLLSLFFIGIGLFLIYLVVRKK